MIVVVSDTSPINYMVLCGTVEVLPSLYERVVIPQSVYAELSSPDAPETVQAWVKRAPSWLSVRSAAHVDLSMQLDLGECEAICLASEIHADSIIVDESKARQIARSRGLVVTGTIGVLELAASKGLLRLSDAIEKLRNTNFHASETLLQQALECDRSRREKDSRNPPAC
jgi:predicted nucleic acid-binding protein